MAENNAAEAGKKSFIERIKDFAEGVKAEYGKIVFPDQEELKKSTVATVTVSIFIGALILIIDFILKLIMGFIL